ncbi:MAG TPA: O-antigen ligase family protein [Pyrinomonadaceae bacterium]|nr:O-antigen ligase family protein [Pyrinomonadaceae bacterium]
MSGVGNDPAPGARRPTPSVLLEWATVACLFLFAAAAPHSIAGAQTSWVLAMLCWAARFLFKPRPRTWRTPVDYALLGFFILTFVSSLFSYEPGVSIGKMRAASLFTIVYVAAQNIPSRRVLRALAVVLVASCAVNVVYTFGKYAAGRGVKVGRLAADSPLRAAGVAEGDTILSVDGAEVGSPGEVERAILAERPAKDKVYRMPDGRKACEWGAEVACVRVYRVEALPAYNVPRDGLSRGETVEARLGLESWTKGRDERATGFYGQYQTYSEVLQLIASVALGMLVAVRRKLSTKGLLLGVVLAGMCGALLLTVTRASWAGFLLSAFTVAAVGASRRALVITAGVALPLALAGLFVLQQKRQVGFIDTQEGSTSWRLIVWREGFDILVKSPRHLLVGVGMDTLKKRWREWGMFDKGRQPWGHLHSTPLQIAFERGVPALVAWLTLLFVYARMLWRMARSRATTDWRERGLVLGALGGLAGFVAAGLVHYNLGDSEVVMIFYFVMGLALAARRLTPAPDPQEN